MRRSACALLVGAWGIFTATASAAGPAWLEPTSLSAGAASPAAVALAAPGDAAAVWARSGQVEARVRAPGGGYAPAAPVGSASGAVDVDLAADGTAVAAWAQTGAVAYALRAPGGSFGTVQQLPPEGGSGDVGGVRVLVDGPGNALIAYTRGRAYAAVKPAGGEAARAEPLSTANACDLGAAIGVAGQAAIVWRDCGNAATPIHVARRTATGFETLDVASGTAPAVAVDADGTVVVAWESTGAVRAAAAPAGAPLSGERKLADASSSPALAGTTDGVWAAWRATTGGRVMGAQRPTGQDFGTPAEIAAEGTQAEAPALAGGGDGSVLAAWLRRDGDSYRVEAARRAPGAGAFATGGLVSAANLETTALRLDADGDGNALAAYVRGGIPTVQTLDAAGPRFAAVDIRSAGHALDPYPFGVDAVDAWSSVASTAFDFGDGATAPGPRAEHAFPRQGEHTVTISATDALGNVSRTQRTFVAAPPLDRVAPVITRARMDSTRFRRSNKETAVVAKSRRRRGTRFRYTLSEPAQVNLFFERVLMGRRRGKVCIRGNRRGRKCRVYEPAGLITRSQPAGNVSVGFSGRIVGRNGPLRVVDVVLAPGRYRATIVAADATRNVSKPVQLAFTILR
jgi:hypothetical protein